MVNAIPALRLRSTLPIRICNACVQLELIPIIPADKMLVSFFNSFFFSNLTFVRLVLKSCTDIILLLLSFPFLIKKVWSCTACPGIGDGGTVATCDPANGNPTSWYVLVLCTLTVKCWIQTNPFFFLLLVLMGTSLTKMVFVHHLKTAGCGGAERFSLFSFLKNGLLQMVFFKLKNWYAMRIGNENRERERETVGREPLVFGRFFVGVLLFLGH